MIELYPAGSTTFEARDMICRLSDAISAKVMQEINGEYELVMTYPMDGVMFEEIKLDRVIRIKPAPGKAMQPFDIYEITRPINGMVTVYAGHVRYRLALIPVSPYAAANIVDALQGLQDNAAEDCPFTFETTRTTQATYIQMVPESAMSRLQGEQGSILQVYGGQYEFDNLTVKLKNRIGQDRGVQVRYGKNLVSLTQEESIRNTITGVYPFWTGLDGEEAGYRELPEKVVHASTASSFPYNRTVPLDLSMEWLEGPPTPEQLRERAEKYIRDNEIGVPDVRLEVSFVDLASTEDYKDMQQLEEVDLGDTVTVIFQRLGVVKKAQITRVVYDGLLDRYESVHIGRVTANLPSVIVQQYMDTQAAVHGASRALAGMNASLNQEAIFNRLTDNGRIQGIYMENGQLYVNASYMKTGILNAEEVQVINLIADKVLSYTPDTTKRTEIVGGRMGYQGKTDSDDYKDLINLNAILVQGAAESFSGAVNMFRMETDGTYVSRALLSSDSVLIGMNPLAIKLDPEDATGEVAAGNVYANHHIVLGPGSDTPDGTFAIGYFRDQQKNVEIVTGLSFIDVNINGTTYKLLGKVAT